MISFRARTLAVTIALLLVTGTTAAQAAPAAPLVPSGPAASAVPARPADSATRHSGWVPAPSSPEDVPAGVLCDFAIHTDPIVDEVMKKTLQTNPDGSPRRELYVGRLVIRVTNVESGAYYDADASGSAVFVYDPDGTVTWYAVGPTLVGFREGAGNLPRGFYVLDGVYRLKFSPDGHRTLTTVHGTHADVCQRID